MRRLLLLGQEDDVLAGLAEGLHQLYGPTPTPGAAVPLDGASAVW